MYASVQYAANRFDVQELWDATIYCAFEDTSAVGVTASVGISAYGNDCILGDWEK